MKIKNNIFLFAYFGAVLTVSCEQISEKNYVFEIKVTDEADQPIHEALVHVAKHNIIATSPLVTAKPAQVDTPTDTSGNASFNVSSVQAPEGFLITKEGFYPTTGRVKWEFPEGFSAKTWKTASSVTLNPIKNPIPMYALDNQGGMEKVVNMPELNKEYGFDLMKSEALPPFGKGETADFFFKVEGTYSSKTEFDLRLEVRFANPEDGVVEFLTPQRQGMGEPQMEGSILISSYNAPEDGYVPGLKRFSRVEEAGVVPDTDVDFKRNFYFRIRTETASDGTIISANYGKIYGDFNLIPANSEWGYLASFALITTYFNPTPNDRNVEFDTKRNLLPDGNVQQP